ncbi:MAG: AraC family transcriptional regulator [Desulfobacteraceae bacterium]|nr:AraC family transcriptional regulator [Desulfobacteraceae bacterium]
MREIIDLMDQLVEKDGFNYTSLCGVKIFKASQYLPREPLCYEQGIIIVAQGSKRVFLGDNEYEYNEDNYLVLTVPLPVECETKGTPFLALMVDINIGILNRIIEQMDNHIDHSLLKQKDKHHGLFLAHTTREIKDSVIRLLTTLQSDVESKVIGPGIVHELIFRIMCQENAAPLYALAMKNTNLSKVDRALRQIHENYQHAININKLTGLVNMSPSAFHRAFKEVTSSSPIQYLKKIRLDKARTLLMKRGMRVNEAATEVGYESATQFSREFKRYFGKTPVSFIDNPSDL